MINNPLQLKQQHMTEIMTRETGDIQTQLTLLSCNNLLCKTEHLMIVSHYTQENNIFR